MSSSFRNRVGRAIFTLGACALLMLPALLVAAEKSAEELAAESEAYCDETAKDAAKITPQMIIEKVNKAAELVAAKGEEAFAAFKGKGSEFLFCGTYIWIHDLNGVMLMHPIKNKMEGKMLLNLKDKNGKMIFVEMNDLAKKNGTGWVEYVWPKPGAKEVSPKTSYVKLVKHGDKEYVVGCGVYDLTLQQVEQSLKAAPAQ